MLAFLMGTDNVVCMMYFFFARVALDQWWAREGQSLLSVESYPLQFPHYRKGKSSGKKRKIITISCHEEEGSGDTEILLTLCCTHHHLLVCCRHRRPWPSDLLCCKLSFWAHCWGVISSLRRYLDFLCTGILCILVHMWRFGDVLCHMYVCINLYCTLSYCKVCFFYMYWYSVGIGFLSFSFYFSIFCAF